MCPPPCKTKNELNWEVESPQFFFRIQWEWLHIKLASHQVPALPQDFFLLFLMYIVHNRAFFPIDILFGLSLSSWRAFRASGPTPIVFL